MVQITHIHLTRGQNDHEHIESVRWINPSSKEDGHSTRESMIQFIKEGGTAIVSDGIRAINVEVFPANPPYIRTRADGIWTDNLLALPQY